MISAAGSANPSRPARQRGREPAAPAADDEDRVIAGCH
jgi:hypothetical protein